MIVQLSSVSLPNCAFTFLRDTIELPPLALDEHNVGDLPGLWPPHPRPSLLVAQEGQVPPARGWTLHSLHRTLQGRVGRGWTLHSLHRTLQGTVGRGWALPSLHRTLQGNYCSLDTVGYFIPALRIRNESGSSFEFSENRILIQAKVPDPCNTKTHPKFNQKEES